VTTTGPPTAISSVRRTSIAPPVAASPLLWPAVSQVFL
jgi:hypothetical protein